MWPFCGLPLDFLWTSFWLPVDFLWTSSGLHLDYLWTFSGLPVDFLLTSCALPVHFLCPWGELLIPEKWPVDDKCTTVLISVQRRGLSQILVHCTLLYYESLMPVQTCLMSFHVQLLHCWRRKINNLFMIWLYGAEFKKVISLNRKPLTSVQTG